MRSKLIIGTLLAVLLSVGGVSTTFATDGDTTNADTLQRTTLHEEADLPLWVGSNLLLLGNNINNHTTVNGLLFAAGNTLQLDTQSEYAFVAGNTISYTAQNNKDLFAAGNVITLQDSATIGRDTFLAGNTVTINTDLPGDLSVACAQLVLNNVTIAGDVNLSINELVITGDTQIAGKLTINTDAKISGEENLSYADVERYEIARYEVTTTTIILDKIISLVSLFIAFTIVMAIFPSVKQRVDTELSDGQLAKNLLVGAAALLLMPVTIIALLMTFVGAPAALILLAAFLVLIYLAQGFTGLWLGKLIIEKLAHNKINDFIEMLIGITLLALLTMIPFIGIYVTIFSVVLGLGLALCTIKPKLNRAFAAPKTEGIKDGTVIAEAKTARPRQSKKSSKK